MQRQIKFRGKPIDPYYNVDFVYGFYMEDLNDGEVVPYIFDEQIKVEVVPDSVGQFTGIKDKNGNDIFEGDILQFSDKKEWYRITTILKSKEFCEEVWSNHEKYPYERRIIEIPNCYEWILSSEIQDWWEVIGTIHTKPELLTDKNK